MRRTGQLIMVLAMAAVVAGAGSIAGAADDEAKKAIEARQAVMKSIGGNVKALKEMIQGDNSETPADASRRANEIAEAAAKIAVAFKPQFHLENAGDIKTTAKPNIWTSQDDFAERAEALENASTKLASAAESEDMEAIKTAFTDMTKVCGGCHQTYRVKKN